MQISRAFKMAVLACALVCAPACDKGLGRNVITSLRISPDEAGSRTPSSFPSAATVYVIVRVANVREKSKVLSRIFYENVEGQPPNTEIPNAQKEAPVQGDTGYAAFNYFYSGDGWPKGTYRVEVSLVTASGEERDRKSATFNVS
jgi:hypothetical protein